MIKVSNPLAGVSLQGLTLAKFLRRETLSPLTIATKWVLGGCAFVLVALIAYELITASLSTSGVVVELGQKVSDARQRVAPATKQNAEEIDYSQISRRNIFGPLTIPTPVGRVEKPVASTSPLTLIGTFVEDQSASYAIIEDDKKKQQDAFGVGDPVFGEGKVLRINSDSVEIERGGQREILMLDDKPTKGGGDFKGGIANVDGNQFIIEEAELDRALENLPLLLTQARAVPYFRDGKATGLRLFAVKSGSLYEKLGLKNGDILKGINGNSLADLSQAMQLFEKLKSERTISVVLERNSEEKEQRYEVR